MFLNSGLLMKNYKSIIFFKILTIIFINKSNIICFVSYSLNTYTSSVDRITNVCFRPSIDSDGLHMAATMHNNVYKLWSPYNLSENERKIKICFLVFINN